MNSRLSLAVYLACHGLIANATESFEGHWVFSEKSGWQWSADFQIEQDGKSASGTWQFGSARPEGRGWEGTFKGEVNGRKLLLHRCYNDGTGWGNEKPKCPTYRKADSYMVRVDDSIRWYTNNAAGHKFFVLTRLTASGGEAK